MRGWERRCGWECRFHPVASAFFGPVERHVGEFDEGRRVVVAGGGGRGDADADGDDAVDGQGVWLGELCDCCVTPFRRPAERRRPALVDV